MKLFAGWAMATGLLAMVPAAQAQVPAPYVVEVSPYAVVPGPDDVYAAMPPEEMPPRPAPRMSATFLRTWYQVASTCCARVSPSRLRKITDSPGRE